MVKREIQDLEEDYFDIRMPLVNRIFVNRLKTAIKLSSLEDYSIILDVGCNRGYLLKMIQNLGVANLHGIDISPAILKPLLDCDLRRVDVRNMPFDDKYFDIVFVLDVLEHVEDLNSAVKEINRVVKSNGIVIMSGPTESWFYVLCRFLWQRKTKYHEHVRSVYEVEKAFQPNGFELIQQKSLPGFPLPQLFRITKYKKIT